LHTALARRYIVRLEAGNFTHEKTEQRSAAYALRWADGWSGNPDGQKTLPEEAGPDRSEILTSNGPISPPEERSGMPTSIKTKLTNETEKQLQVEVAAASPALEILLKEGFSKETARELAAAITPEVIRQQIAWLPHRAPASSRLGMLRRAMEGTGRHPPDFGRPKSLRMPPIPATWSGIFTPVSTQTQGNHWPNRRRRNAPWPNRSPSDFSRRAPNPMRCPTGGGNLGGWPVSNGIQFRRSKSLCDR
jgi:hypothetical protein